MADLIHSRTTQQITASGLAGLLGLFALLCAVFAGCVTISDWHSETTQARWPVVSALVERAKRRSADGNADIAHCIFGNRRRKAAILGGAAPQG
jgi:hypothetical protein